MQRIGFYIVKIQVITIAHLPSLLSSFRSLLWLNKNKYINERFIYKIHTNLNTRIDTLFYCLIKPLLFLSILNIYFTAS